MVMLAHRCVPFPLSLTFASISDVLLVVVPETLTLLDSNTPGHTAPDTTATATDTGYDTTTAAARATAAACV